MSTIHRLEIVIDRSADLAPQVIVYRTMGVPWAFLERLTGRRRNRLEEMVARFRKRQEAQATEPVLTLSR